MKKAICGGVLVLAMICGQTMAGVHLELVSLSVDEDGMVSVISLEGWVEGDRGKFEFKELGDLIDMASQPLQETFPRCAEARASIPGEDEDWGDEDEDPEEYNAMGNALWGPGSFLLTDDGGHSIVIVNARMKAYFDWSLDQTLPIFGSLMSGIQQATGTTFGAPAVNGPNVVGKEQVAGHETTHYSYRSSFDSTTSLLGMKITSTTESDQELWVTDSIEGEALKVWLKKDPPLTGNPQIDRLIMVELESIPGYPLKSMSVDRTRTSPGSGSVTCKSTWVTKVEQQEIPAETFTIPEGYEKKEFSLTSLFE
ncbi:MAG: hypothetical protein JSU96_06835 [Acidobacteriota bacterium]|nr:MAG: hypothetical protein JSU96_06835 [Acidobacteriota bacterium]